MTHLTSPTDLGKYDLKQMLRNPALIHKIQDDFQKIEVGKLLSGGIVGGSIFAYGKTNPHVVIKFIHETYQHHPDQVISLISKDTIKLIGEYMETEPKETIDDIPEELFKSPALYQDTEGKLGGSC